MTFPVESFSSVHVELVHDTRAPNVRLNRYKTAGTKAPYYRIWLTAESLDFAEAAKVNAVLDSYQGELETFLIKNPMPAVLEVSDKTLSAAASTGDSFLLIAGFSPNQTGVLRAGDFLKVNGSQKVYRIKTDCNSNGSGVAIVDLTQKLLSDFTSGSAVTFGSNVYFQVCMTKRDSEPVLANKGKLSDIDVELIEQL